jgi:hypothetical protein
MTDDPFAPGDVEQTRWGLGASSGTVIFSFGRKWRKGVRDGEGGGTRAARALLSKNIRPHADGREAH